jgi:3'-5' exonuclease
MLKNINSENILFLDIETVPASAAYGELNDRFRALWNKKAEYLARTAQDTPESLYSKAGIYAEFGRIICISTGFIAKQEFRLKSFYGHDEKKLLEEFISFCENKNSSGIHLMCGHNAKEFDFPYISRRVLINGLRLPDMLNIAGKKPWEIPHLDTMELWKFGDYKNYTSLDLLAALFNIPTPKDDIDGSEIAGVYWKEKNLQRIVKYCEKDVLAVARLLLKYLGKPLIQDEQVISETIFTELF